MPTDRSWMYRRIIDNVVSVEFRTGVETFIQFALGNPNAAIDCNGCIQCPCIICKNLKWISPWEVQRHLYRKGFVEGYLNWTCHGEGLWSHELSNVEGTSTYMDMVATHQGRLKKALKRAPTFQEVFDDTHKKKGTDQYISERAREVAESYSRHMSDKYAEEDHQPQLDPDLWVATSGAPKKGHVYGFGNSLDTRMVLSGFSSSGSRATSPFTTPAPPGTAPDDVRGFIRDEISGMERRLVQTIRTEVSDAVQAQLSQALSQALPDRDSSSQSALGSSTPPSCSFIE